MASLSAEELACHVCCESFKAPVLLSCGHSLCEECFQQFENQECPVCRRRSSKRRPSFNVAMKNLSELFLKQRREDGSPGSEEICSLHGEKLKLFCLEDEQLVCVLCRDSQKYINQSLVPISEAASSRKEELNGALESLQNKRYHNEIIQMNFERAVQHIESQARKTEQQIKLQFEKLHQFLRDEEEAAITALREEEEPKKQVMKKKLEEISRRLSALSHTLKHTEKMMKASNVCFLKEFPVSKERVRLSSQPQDPEMPSGALIQVPRYLGNLTFRVWEKMENMVQNTPVVLDPNTAHSYLAVSSDLTGVRWRGSSTVPANPERFDQCLCVLGSEGFTSGTHSWDVEVKDSKYWRLGVTTASNPRKGHGFFDTDVWSVQYDDEAELSAAFGYVRRKLDRVRVKLDYDKGMVSFSDPVTDRHIYTFTTTFADPVFPLFSGDIFSISLRILAVNSP